MIKINTMELLSKTSKGKVTCQENLGFHTK